MTTNCEINVKLLLTDIMNEKPCSHCRLCLRCIEKQFVRFSDFVTLDDTLGIFRQFSNILTTLFYNEQWSEEIPGIEVVCPDCAKKAIEAVSFIENCKRSNTMLSNILTNLMDTLNIDVDLSKDQSSMYIILEEENSRLLLVQNKSDKKIVKSKLQKVKNSVYDCLVCYTDLFDLDNLKSHNLSMHSLLTCETCLQTFTYNGELKYHVNSVHKYQCPHCELRKDTKEQLHNHIDYLHTSHVCKECGIVCEGLEKLQAHEYKHCNYKKYQCTKCGKVYSSKPCYKKHVKLCLENRIDPHPIRSELIKSFVCKICQKPYSSLGGLRVHNRFTHGNAKHHVCKCCGKKFTAPSYLKAHMITHTGEKKFKCEICENNFVSKAALLYHTRRHTGEKPYSCNQCNKKFVNASARAEHIKSKHIGRTLMCEICSKKFVTKNFLKKHMNRHRNPNSKLFVSKLPFNKLAEENLQKL